MWEALSQGSFLLYLHSNITFCHSLSRDSPRLTSQSKMKKELYGYMEYLKEYRIRKNDTVWEVWWGGGWGRIGWWRDRSGSLYWLGW